MYYYTKEQRDADSINHKSATRRKNEAKKQADKSLDALLILRIVKIAIAVLLVCTYFLLPQYLTELLVIGLVFSLIFPNYSYKWITSHVDFETERVNERWILSYKELKVKLSFAFEE